MQNEGRFLTDEIREQIARRAYEVYAARGGQDGRDMDDWLQAEREVMAELEQQERRPPTIEKMQVATPLKRPARAS